MTTTPKNPMSGRLRLVSLALLAAVVAVAMAVPGAANAKKRSTSKCTTKTTHVKGHKTKRKRCTRRKRRPGRSTTSSTSSSSATGKPTAAEVQSCREEQAIDPESFEQTYADGEGADPFDTCVRRAQGSTQTTNNADDTSDDDSG